VVKFNNDGIKKLMEKIGRDHGERYTEVDGAARIDQAATPMSEADREVWLREQLAQRQLAELTNMSGWARAIVAGEPFEISIKVQ
jgi:hypothetical protein